MKKLTGSSQCTRCHRRVADSDADARFKHGEIIACRNCTQPRHPGTATIATVSVNPAYVSGQC